MKFKIITIIGVGEIGASIGKALKKKHLAEEIIGIGRRNKSLEEARKIKAVDRVFLIDKIGEGVKNSDLIILATPVGKIVNAGIKAGLYAKEGAIITDVGSTKKEIVEILEKKLSPSVKFVGSHPMAGSEKSGPLNADENLFKGRDCFVTKTKNTDRDALTEIKKFWSSLGANPREISLEEHDMVVAKVSHMAHIVASSLVIADKDVLDYVASGFKDTTRIALSKPELWRDICITNNKNIAKSIGELINILKKFSKAISRKKGAKIEKMLEEARKLRKQLE